MAGCRDAARGAVRTLQIVWCRAADCTEVDEALLEDACLQHFTAVSASIIVHA